MEQNKKLLPSQIGCIDLEWLKEQIEKVNNGLISSTEVLQYLSNNIFPLTPLLQDAWGKGSIFRDYLNKGSKWDGLKPIDRNDYMVSQIKININERDNNK